MRKWQYKVITTSPKAMTITTLNEDYGQEGWELIQINHPDLDGFDTFEYLFKRLID